MFNELMDWQFNHWYTRDLTTWIYKLAFAAYMIYIGVAAIAGSHTGFGGFLGGTLFGIVTGFVALVVVRIMLELGLVLFTIANSLDQITRDSK